eukprot:gnl/Spiro4/28621_TR14164_c0_g2_i1.p1 gnl/Spiro4/28621_TR14164_c0_g2~~gnl/Spiro4/28621_TR14164_c0_g2_i1.p1  ORF type:complete len:500 (-),score=74.45 gnl/Spiro4/28621_TR14164_c0_g2_i1:123-1622(-)
MTDDNKSNSSYLSANRNYGVDPSYWSLMKSSQYQKPSFNSSSVFDQGFASGDQMDDRFVSVVGVGGVMPVKRRIATPGKADGSRDFPVGKRVIPGAHHRTSFTDDMDSKFWAQKVGTHRRLKTPGKGATEMANQTSAKHFSTQDHGNIIAKPPPEGRIEGIRHVGEPASGFIRAPSRRHKKPLFAATAQQASTNGILSHSTDNRLQTNAPSAQQQQQQQQTDNFSTNSVHTMPSKQSAPKGMMAFLCGEQPSPTDRRFNRRAHAHNRSVIDIPDAQLDSASHLARTDPGPAWRAVNGAMLGARTVGDESNGYLPPVGRRRVPERSSFTETVAEQVPSHRSHVSSNMIKILHPGPLDRQENYFVDMPRHRHSKDPSNRNHSVFTHTALLPNERSFDRSQDSLFGHRRVDADGPRFRPSYILNPTLMAPPPPRGKHLSSHRTSQLNVFSYPTDNTAPPPQMGLIDRKARVPGRVLGPSLYPEGHSRFGYVHPKDTSTLGWP